MQIDFQPVRVAVPGGHDSRLAFADGWLVAVLVCLPEEYGSEAGRWFLEAGFARLDGVRHPTFTDLDEAETWMAERIADGV
jgi:hypothetical protein